MGSVEALWLSTRVSRSLGGYGVYVFRAGDCLIDAGFRHARSAFLAWPALDGVSACLLTHHHEDHIGNADALKERGVPVLAPPPVIRAAGSMGRLQLYQRVIWGTPASAGLQPLDAAYESAGWRLVPVSTPGHASDHHIYHEPDRGLIFSGDLYLGRRVDSARPDEDVHALLDSLRTVRALGPEAVYCAHRGRLDEPERLLSEKIGWLEDLVAAARVLAERGLSVRAIARRLLGREGAVYWVTLGDMSHRNLIESALSRP